MENSLKILGFIVAVYIGIGLIFALRFSFFYDPNYTSFPNNLTVFLFNTFLWPLHF